MFKYMYNAHKQIVILIVVDLILLLLTTLLVVVNAHGYNITPLPAFIAYLIFYFIRAQTIIFLGIIGYLFSGIRLQNFIRHIGKNQSFMLLSFFLITVLIIGLSMSFLLINWRLTSTSYIVFGFINPWYLFIMLLLNYQLLKYSSYKYSSNKIKALIVGCVILGGSLFAHVLNTTIVTLTSANSFLVTNISNAITPINLTPLISYNQITLIIISVSIIILTIATVQIILIKKVGH